MWNSIPWQNRLNELTKLKKTVFLQLFSKSNFEAMRKSSGEYSNVRRSVRKIIESETGKDL